MKQIQPRFNLFLFGILCVFSSCSINESSTDSKDNKYCSNEVSLFSIADSIQSLSLDFNSEKDSILNYIENELQTDLCWNVVQFGLNLSNVKPVKVQLLKECDDKITGRIRHYTETRVLLNHEGLVMIGSEVTPMDSTKMRIYNNCTNEYGFTGFSIDWDSETPTDSIKNVFINIIDGYLMKYKQLSQETFSKAVCDLSKTEIDSLKEMLPFKIRLRIGERMIVEEPLEELNFD